MFLLLSATNPCCASEDKCFDGLTHACRKLRHNVGLLVVVRDVLLIIVNRTNDRQFFLLGNSSRSVRTDSEDARRTDIVRWGRQVDDETPRKEILAVLVVLAIGIDKDVGKRCRGVADVRALLRSEEHTSELQSRLHL